jgi:hypothetical protein
MASAMSSSATTASSHSTGPIPPHSPGRIEFSFHFTCCMYRWIYSSSKVA